MKIQDYLLTGLVFLPIGLTLLLSSILEAIVKECNVFFRVYEVEGWPPIPNVKVTLDSNVKYTNNSGEADMGFYPTGTKLNYNVSKTGYKTQKNEITIPKTPKYIKIIYLEKI